MAPAGEARAAIREAVLEFQIDRRVILSAESEHKSLYKWSLQELDTVGKKIGLDQIPWDWALYFTATELALVDDFEIELDDSNNEIDKKATREKQSITAKLSPGDPRVWGSYRNTVYSMFGTDRAISDFSLAIYPAAEEKQESCRVWGCVSYTAEIDFYDETRPDTILFHLFVSPSTFARYSGKIAASEVDEAVFRVSRVAGFYSEWSPSISTDAIKVLTRDKEHEVKIPGDCEVVPPRLGAVGEAALYLRRINKLKAPTVDMVDEEDEWPNEELSRLGSSEEADGRPLNLFGATITRAIKLLSSLRLAAWIIAVLLFLILVK